MDTIRNDETDVEDIMLQIKENIKKRRESGANRKTVASSNEPLQNNSTGQFDIQDYLDYLNSNWDLKAEYSISSHRPVIGVPLVWGRQVIHGEVRRYVDLLAAKQAEFNYRVACTLAALDNKIDKKIKEEIDVKVNETITAINRDIENKAWLANLLDKRVKTKLGEPLPAKQTHEAVNYLLFEEQYRGSIEEIKSRQNMFLEYFKNSQNVLDIGCGRGEFLMLLKENGISAKGIDINEDMVRYCQKNGLDVQKTDVLSYLNSLEDKSLDGVFSGQVIEHLQPNDLINLVKLCYDKMKYGTYFIAETVNPLCLGIFSTNFYLDLSHIKPVHPETIKFLLESAGFREIQFKFFSPFPEEARLKNIEPTDLPEKLKKDFEVLNQNINKLNDMIYGFRDYAVIGKK